MKTFQLEGTPRTDLGKKAVKALRKQNLIPAVLNGGQLVTLPYDNALKAGEKVVEIANNQALIVTDFTVSTESVRKLVYTPEIFAIDLTIGDKKTKAVIKDIQFHPVTDAILHMDFLEVNEQKPIIMEVPRVRSRNQSLNRSPSRSPNPNRRRKAGRTKAERRTR